MASKDKLDIVEVLDYIGLKKSTWTVYKSRGITPKNDGYFGPSRGPWWYRETLDNWKLQRKRARGKINEDGNRVRINRTAYDEAAKLIDNGVWMVYPEIGIVDAPNMNSANNYLYVRFMDISSGEMYQVMVHRLIYEWKTGSYVPIDDALVIDHMNRIRWDNRQVNLRAITWAENLTNTVMSESRVSIVPGQEEE